MVDRRELAIVLKFAETAFFDGIAEVEVALGAFEVLDRDGNDIGSGRLCLGAE